MFNLEHLILFGLSENKLEWFEGRTHCRLPFATRREAEDTFLRCAETLERWQGTGSLSPIERDGSLWQVEANGIKLELVARVIEAELPIYPAALHEFQTRFWRPSCWPRLEDVPPGGGSGPWQYSETRTNLAIYFMNLTRRRRNGWSSARGDISLGNFANVQPEMSYYSPERKGCLVDGDYFVGAPDLIVEILAPATAAWIRGSRARLYARAGVRHFWVAIPETDSLETWVLSNGEYSLAASYQVGEQFTHPLFPDHEIDVREMLHSPWGRHWTPDLDSARDGDGDEPEPKDVADPSSPIPIHNLILGGHPDRRYEVIDDRGPCIVAFGSEAAAEQRFQEWALEIGRWENTTVIGLGDHLQTARFNLRHDGPRVELDVTTPVAMYRELMRMSFDDSAWKEYDKAKGWDRPG